MTINFTIIDLLQYLPQQQQQRWGLWRKPRSALRQTAAEAEAQCCIACTSSSSSFLRNTSSGGSTRSRPEEHRGAATGALLLLINTITASELRINFTPYQLQDQSGVPEAEAEASGVGDGDRRASASPTSSSGGSRDVARHHHHNQPAGLSGPVRRLKRTSTATSAKAVSGGIVDGMDQRGGGGWRRTRSSVDGGGPSRGRRRSCSWAGSSAAQELLGGGSGPSPEDGWLRRLAMATRPTGGGGKETGA